MAWIRQSQIHFAQIAHESTRLDYLHEVEHMGERVMRLEQAIAEEAKLASPELREVIQGLQALRGIAHISAITIAAELGQISRFEGARQLMGYSGMVPSEDSSGERKQRGSITKTGNSHLRRIAVEAAWSYRLPPGVGPVLRKRQEGVPEEIKEIAWKARHRLHKRYCRLAATRKDQRKIITAMGRELLGFIWAIGIKAETAARLRIASDEKQKPSKERKRRNNPINEYRRQIRGQGQQQPEHARRRALGISMRQAQPDSRH